MRIGYVCQGGARHGWGHVQRGRTLLEVCDHGSMLVVGDGADMVGDVLHDSGIVVQPWTDAERPCGAQHNDFDVIVVDDYYVPAGWIADSASSRPTFVVDDWMRTSFVATGLVNVNVGASSADYPDAVVDRWVLGPQYALVRRGIRDLPRRQPPPAIGDMLITLGGADPDGHTPAVAEDLVRSEWFAAGGRLTIVLGASYGGAHPGAEWPAAFRERITVVQQPVDFAQRLRASDLVICGASTASYELACLGTPFVPVAFVDNQAGIVMAWQREGVGAGVRTWIDGWRTALADHVASLVADPSAVARAAAAAAALVDGKGAHRLAAALRDAVAA